MRLYLPIVLLLGLCAYSFVIHQNQFEVFKEDSTLVLEAIQDAMIKVHGENDNLSHGDSHYLDLYALPGCSEISVARVLLEFDLLQIDPSKEIEEAKLLLYNDESTYFKRKHILEEDQNQILVSGLQEPWKEQKVTWKAQPKISKLHRTLANSIEDEMSDCEIDITNLVIEMNAAKESYFGFLLQLEEEEPKRRFAFVSKEYEDKTLAPKLLIKYKKDGLSKLDSKLKNPIGKDLEVFPNPSNGVVHITYVGKSQPSLVVYNSNAQEILIQATLPEKHKIDLTGYPEGQYFLHFTDGGTKYIEPIIIQE